MSVRMALRPPVEKTIIARSKSNPNWPGQDPENGAICCGSAPVCQALCEAPSICAHAYACTCVSLGISHPHNNPATWF